MGYSIAAPIRNVALRDKMMALLKAEYRKWPKVIGPPWKDSHLRGPRKDDLSYHHGKKPYIGFDYNAGGAEREYAFCFIRWLAIRIGCKKKGLPYYVYDGHENIALLVDGTAQDEEGSSVVDRFGVPIETPDSRKIKGVWDKLFELRVYTDRDDVLDLIRAEIQRLDALWEKMQDHAP
jgi:hypothetical protein